jgi:cytoskeletal protein CcmA (bactofilin family)
MDNNSNYSGVVCTLAAGTVVEGSLELKSNLRLEGEVTGEVFCEGVLVMSKDAKITGNIECAELKSEGKIEGNVNAKDRIELKETSKLNGNVECSSIEIDKGAIFNGQCTMKQKEA